MPAERYEIAVVGGGKGGKTLAAKMASAGNRVSMMEKGMIGGSCINVACIPTKTMVKSAKVAELARRAADFGIRVRTSPRSSRPNRGDERDTRGERSGDFRGGSDKFMTLPNEYHRYLASRLTPIQAALVVRVL